VGGALEGITSTFAFDKNIVCVHTTSLCIKFVCARDICTNMQNRVIFSSYLVPEEQCTSREHKSHSKDECADALSDSIADPLPDPRPRTIAHSPMNSIGARRVGTRVCSHHEEIKLYCAVKTSYCWYLTFVLPGMEWNLKLCLILFPWSNTSYAEVCSIRLEEVNIV
jgi:hypothetical protein